MDASVEGELGYAFHRHELDNDMLYTRYLAVSSPLTYSTNLVHRVPGLYCNCTEIN